MTAWHKRVRTRPIDAHHALLGVVLFGDALCAAATGGFCGHFRGDRLGGRGSCAHSHCVAAPTASAAPTAPTATRIAAWLGRHYSNLHRLRLCLLMVLQLGL